MRIPDAGMFASQVIPTQHPREYRANGALHTLLHGFESRRVPEILQVLDAIVKRFNKLNSGGREGFLARKVGNNILNGFGMETEKYLLGKAYLKPTFTALEPEGGHYHT